MIRKAFMMTLIPGHQAEYQRRHQPTWPEVEEVLREHGVQNYSIFLNRETNQLFGYAEIESEALWQQISQTDACRRWWSYMNELMFTNSDNSPVTVTLDEVFHLD